MIKHCCDICGTVIEKPNPLDCYANTNLMFKIGADTMHLELCNECLKSVEALLRLRKGFADAD